MGARRRWLRGGAEARHRHAVASSHRFVSSSLETEATTQISEHIAPHRPVRIVVSTRLFQPRTLVKTKPKPWPTVRPSGCKNLERHLDWDPVRQRGRGSAGRMDDVHAVEEELIGAFLIAPDDADAFRDFPRGNPVTQSRGRESRV